MYEYRAGVYTEVAFAVLVELISSTSNSKFSLVVSQSDVRQAYDNTFHDSSCGGLAAQQCIRVHPFNCRSSAHPFYQSTS